MMSCVEATATGLRPSAADVLAPRRSMPSTRGVASSASAVPLGVSRMGLRTRSNSWKPQLLFQLLDMARHRRLPQLQLGRGLGDAAEPGGDAEASVAGVAPSGRRPPISAVIDKTNTYYHTIYLYKIWKTCKIVHVKHAKNRAFARQVLDDVGAVPARQLRESVREMSVATQEPAEEALDRPLDTGAHRVGRSGAELRR